MKNNTLITSLICGTVLLLIGVGFALFMMGFMAEGQTAIKEELTDSRRKLIKLVKKIDEDKDTKL